MHVSAWRPGEGIGCSGVELRGCEHRWVLGTQPQSLAKLPAKPSLQSYTSVFVDTTGKVYSTFGVWERKSPDLKNILYSTPPSLLLHLEAAHSSLEYAAYLY